MTATAVEDATFAPTRDVAQPLPYESRENYALRTGRYLAPCDWHELVVATVIRKNGLLDTYRRLLAEREARTA